MIAHIVRLSIRYAGVVVALALVVVVYGIYRLFGADLNVFPEFSPSQVVIQTEAPGLSAELVETQVTARIEAALAGVTGIESLRSQSIPGLSVVTLIFGERETVFRKRQLVTERLSLLAAQLPPGIGPPAMTPLTSSASTVLGVGLTSDTRSLMELRSLVDWTVRPHLLSVTGVADVNVFGGEVRQWQVQVDPQRLLTLGLAVQDVLAAVRAAAGILGTGFIEGANQRIVIAAEGQPRSPPELAEAVVAMREGRAIRVGDVARVVEGPAPTISAALIDGRPGVFLMVQGQLGANVRSTTLALEASLTELKPLFDSERVTFHPGLFRPANFIETAVGNVQRDILIGSALVIAVLFLFLYEGRTAFICATAIPVSLIGAVLVLDYFGVDLNIMVLGGLAIALGEVVDDAIIDTENIFRRLRQNRAARQSRERLRSGAERLDRGAQLCRLRHLHRRARVRSVAHPLRGGRQALRAARARIHPRHPRVAGGGDDADSGALLPAAGQRAAEGAGPAGYPLDQTALRVAAGAGRTPSGRGHRSGRPGARDRHRHVPVLLGRVHPGAEGRSLHHPHVGGTGHLATGVAAHRQTCRRRTARHRRRAVGGAVGRARRAGRRYLRRPLQRVRGRDRRAPGARADAHPERDPRRRSLATASAFQA